MLRFKHFKEKGSARREGWERREGGGRERQKNRGCSSLVKY
jgi:hypothetical protein